MTLAPPPSYPRCFIALGPDAATRLDLADRAARLPGTPLRPADLHLTLAFLGGLDAGQADRLAEALGALATAVPPLDSLAFELWPHPAHPRVAVQAYALSDRLRALVAQVQAILRSMDLPVETRPFRPHVTLARFGHDRAVPPIPAAPQAPPAAFDSLGLYCLAARETGLRYQVLYRWALPR
ncbi:RNA 2',3'-cyclic phosphodiesterase [Pigmentiphaga sp. GD03639]|jgi:2'-5' RNA ligase|uniref:RNA 2',3'-cyclic phosphodiesterase n=1 Tax=unclassified Pigmentiphaga TaxID=2626614 RepID=UPI00104A0A0A|nr:MULTISPECIES: RNA 2',3'-cyclic phosphodiesterase [unclassified Pigmentiphaga]MDH2236485.1 RNA 2',3'-cyclic phosphodiesterase [Pigmentiphaga sp. GD03639]